MNHHKSNCKSKESKIHNFQVFISYDLWWPILSLSNCCQKNLHLNPQFQERWHPLSVNEQGYNVYFKSFYFLWLKYNPNKFLESFLYLFFHYKLLTPPRIWVFKDAVCKLLMFLCESEKNRQHLKQGKVSTIHPHFLIL